MGELRFHYTKPLHWPHSEGFKIHRQNRPAMCAGPGVFLLI
jgi:hypothetical protein